MQYYLKGREYQEYFSNNYYFGYFKTCNKKFVIPNEGKAYWRFFFNFKNPFKPSPAFKLETTTN